MASAAFSSAFLVRLASTRGANISLRHVEQRLALSRDQSSQGEGIRLKMPVSTKAELGLQYEAVDLVRDLVDEHGIDGAMFLYED